MNVKKILVATDFSNCSKKTIKYALAIAKKEKADIFLLHAIELIEDDKVYEVEHAIEKADIHLMKDQISDLIDEEEQNDGAQIAKDKIHILEEHGKYEKVILKKAEELKIDLIIMGTHGPTTFTKKIIGTTTDHIVKNANCSVLCVKPDGYPLFTD